MPDLVIVPPNQTSDDLVALAREHVGRWLAADVARNHGDLASGTGRSRGALSQFLQAKYAGDNVGIARDLLQFLDRNAKQEQASLSLQPVETPTYKAVTVALEMAMYSRRMAIVYGEPGCGKTFAAQQFVNRDPKGCLMVMGRYGLGQPKGFLAELVRLLEGKEQETYRQPARMARQSLDELRKRPRFLIINDGQILRFRVFEFLTALIEQSNIGVAVIGHEVMKDNILAGKRIDSETYDRIADFSSFTWVSHRAIQRRDGAGKVLETIHDGVDYDDVAGVVRQILPDATDDALALFADVNVFPSMRAVVNTARDVRGLLARRKAACNRQLVAQALRLRRPAGV